MTNWHRICSLSEVSEDLPFVAEVEGEQMVVFKSGGEYFALRDVCSHAFARLSEGFVMGRAVECPLHGALFDLRTGKCISNPPYDDIRAYAVRIAENDIFVEIPL